MAFYIIQLHQIPLLVLSIRKHFRNNGLFLIEFLKVSVINRLILMGSRKRTSVLVDGHSHLLPGQAYQYLQHTKGND